LVILSRYRDLSTAHHFKFMAVICLAGYGEEKPLPLQRHDHSNPADTDNGLPSN
jgi:hypothetical protein